MNGSFSDYDDALLNELDKDTRVGDHDWMVSEVREEAWADGSPRFKVQGVLLTSGSVRCDLTWSPPPPASVVKSEMLSWTASRRRGVKKAIGIGKKLAEWYGKSVQDLKAGDVIRVKTGKTKVDKVSGKGGFIEVQVILPKEQIGQASATKAAAADAPPF
jgi:hypothetical protein